MPALAEGIRGDGAETGAGEGEEGVRDCFSIPFDEALVFEIERYLV